VPLLAVAKTAEGADYAIAAPVAINVVPPPPWPALRETPAGLQPGVLLTLAGGRPQVIRDARAAVWFTNAGGQPNQTYRLEGYFSVPADDTYQFVPGFLGDLRIDVDGRKLGEYKGEPFGFKYLPVSLARGLHKLEVSGRTGGVVRLELGFGGQGVRPVDAQAFKCLPPR
jgi:hypothetical protein